MLSQRHQTTTLNLLLGRRPESIGGEGNDSSQSPPCLAPDVTLRGGLAFIARWDPFRAHQRNTPQKVHKTKERIPNEPSQPRCVCMYVRNCLSFGCSRWFRRSRLVLLYPCCPCYPWCRGISCSPLTFTHTVRVRSSRQQRQNYYHHHY